MNGLPQPGVVWSPTPPSGLSQSIARAVERVATTIPEGKSGGLVAIATERGANLAFVHRLGEFVQVTAWVGKSGWDSSGVEVGAEMLLVW